MKIEMPRYPDWPYDQGILAWKVTVSKEGFR
jgi:hypothetical protein